MNEHEEDVLTYLIRKNTVTIRVSTSQSYDDWYDQHGAEDDIDLPHIFLDACRSLVRQGILDEHHNYPNLFTYTNKGRQFLSQQHDYLKQREYVVLPPSRR